MIMSFRSYNLLIVSKRQSQNCYIFFLRNSSFFLNVFFLIYRVGLFYYGPTSSKIRFTSVLKSALKSLKFVHAEIRPKILKSDIKS